MYEQCCEILRSQYFDAFFKPAEVAHLIARSLLLKNLPSTSVPSLEDDVSTLMSPLAFKRLPNEEWTKLIKEELTSLSTQMVEETHGSPSLEDLQTLYCSKCIDNTYFGMEVWMVEACECDFASRTGEGMWGWGWGLGAKWLAK